MENNTQSISEKALQIALSYEGKEEVPRNSNAGPFVEACLKLVGLGKGFSWCQAFVYRCFNEAGTNPVPKTAGVLDCWHKANPVQKYIKQIATAANITPGSQFIYDHGKGMGHTGIVVEMHADGSFTTIEGNTDPAGSSNGYGVFKRTRHTSDKELVGFICYS